MPEIKIDPIQIAPPVIPDIDITTGVIENITEIVKEDNFSNAIDRIEADRSATLKAVEKAADSAIEVINQVEKGDTAKDVASKAADNGNIDVATTGATADMTQTAENTASAGMNVKTNGGDEKKYQLGFALSGYKSIIQKNGNQQNTIPGMGASLADDDIKWLVSVYAHYENGSKGFNQTKPCKLSGGGDDGHGITLSCWSITQFDNFRELATYMRAEQMDPGLCDRVAKSQDTKGDYAFNKALENDFTRIFAPTNKGATEYKQLVAATTKMYRDRWWTALLWAIYNSGVKSKLGMAFIARWMGLTGGEKTLYQKSLRAGAFYHLNSNVDELTKLEPSTAGPEKERDWIIAVAKRHRSV